MKSNGHVFPLVRFCIVIFLSCFLGACARHLKGTNFNLPNYAFSKNEPDWIRNGEPISYEGDLWYPQDMYDVLMDTEVLSLGEHQGVQFFVGKIDVRPYDRLYTKFAHNKFRVYKKKPQHDKSPESL